MRLVAQTTDEGICPTDDIHLGIRRSEPVDDHPVAAEGCIAASAAQSRTATGAGMNSGLELHGLTRRDGPERAVHPVGAGVRIDAQRRLPDLLDGAVRTRVGDATSQAGIPGHRLRDAVGTHDPLDRGIDQAAGAHEGTAGAGAGGTGRAGAGGRSGRTRGTRGTSAGAGSGAGGRSGRTRTGRAGRAGAGSGRILAAGAGGGRGGAISGTTRTFISARRGERTPRQNSHDTRCHRKNISHLEFLSCFACKPPSETTSYQHSKKLSISFTPRSLQSLVVLILREQ